MRKYLRSFFLPVVAFVTQTCYAQWNTVGTVGFSEHRVQRNILTSDSKGKIYVTYLDSLSSNNGMVVKTFNGTAWDTLSRRVVPDFFTMLDAFSIACDRNDSLYIVTTSFTVMVRRYNGTTWDSIAVNRPNNFISRIPVNAMAFDKNNQMYVAYSQFNHPWTPYVSTLKDTLWEVVGNGPVCTTGGFYLSMILDNDNQPVVAYAENGSQKASVRRFNGTAWQTLGVDSFTAGKIMTTSLAVDKQNNLYLAYFDMANSAYLTVRKFDGQSWNLVGSPFPAGNSGYREINLVVDAKDNLYVAYSNSNLGNRLTVMQYDGSTWNNISLTGFGSNPVNFVYMTTDAFGNLLVSYQDIVLGRKLTVKKYGNATAMAEPLTDIENTMVYPNPANNTITIEGEGLTNTTAFIYNAQGQLLREMQFSVDIDVTTLQTGFHFIEFRDSANMIVGRCRFMKE